MSKSPQELMAERTKRLEDVTALRQPDRVPVAALDSGVSVKYGGLTWAEAMYDMEKLQGAARKLTLDCEPDAFMLPVVFNPGQALDPLNFKQLRWAGAKLKENRVADQNVFQFVEPGTSGCEAMPAEDYDWFLDDPSDYVLRRHWPRIAKALEPFRDLPPLHEVVSYYVGLNSSLAAFGAPGVVEAFKVLAEAAQATAKHGEAVQPYVKEMLGRGYPPMFLAMGIAPFDYFGDFFRGTRGCMLDMYRRPDKLKEAIDRVTPWIIDWSLRNAAVFKELTNRVFIPIHKAAGGFMSEEQHREFFWPSLRRVLLALIDEGYTPYVYTEGIYTDRLEAIRDVPKGKVIYHIESDIFKAKEVLGDTCCIAGGPPGALMNLGEPEEVKQYCKKLIETVGKGGGFIMDVEVPMITAKPENVRALYEATKEYGVY